MWRTALEGNTAQPSGRLDWKERAGCSFSWGRYPQAHRSPWSLKQEGNLQSVRLLSGGCLLAEASSDIILQILLQWWCPCLA